MSEESHHHTSYVKIWAILLCLLGVSIIGPMFEIQILTLITAFGIAVVKAYLVAKHFMHLNLQPRYITYVMATCLTLMVVFWAGIAPDILNQEGTNWVKTDSFVGPTAQGEPHDDGHSAAH